MKTFIAALLLILTSAIVHADSNMDRQSYCSTYGAMIKSIAAWRDKGVSPETTLELITGVKGVTPQVKKDSIKTIYFDKSFTDLRGPELGNQVRLDCLAGQPGIKAVEKQR